MASTVTLYLAIAFLWTHELDAMARHEWRVLPVLRSLPETTARHVFLWAHVPLVVISIWVVVAGAGQVGADILMGFCVLHAGLHHVYRSHPAYEFHGLGSRALILGAAVFGALYWLARLAG